MTVVNNPLSKFLKVGQSAQSGWSTPLSPQLKVTGHASPLLMWTYLRKGHGLARRLGCKDTGPEGPIVGWYFLFSSVSLSPC